MKKNLVKSKMKKNLASLKNAVENIEFFESESYVGEDEMADEVDSFNAISFKRGAKMPQKRIMQTPPKVIGNYASKTGLAQSSPLGTGIKAQFDIIIQSKFGAEGNLDCEAPIFGYNSFKGLFLKNGFAHVHEFKVDQGTGNLVFTFKGQNGTAVDVIISCVQVPYISLLEMIASRKFRIGGMRIDVGDPKLLPVMQRQIRERKTSMFGNASDQSISLNSFAKGSDYHLTIRDIPLVADIDPFVCYNFPVPKISGSEGYQYSIALFVEIFEK